MLVALGGCDAQLNIQVATSIQVGNNRARLIDVLTDLLPFVAYSRAFGGMRAINEATAA